MHYEEALAWIHSIARFGMNQGLERIEALLDLLGNPHRACKYLHIGGTNGKGSTAAFAASMLEEAGYRVGLYTSPYLEQFTNRMAVNGQDISRRHLVELVQQVKPLVEKIAADPALGQPTEFEVVTALAFCYFAREAPDIVVLEVGLGGRLDATNVVQPLVSAITTISLEHTQVLGDTVEAIAREKAGIIKEGAPVVTQAGGAAVPVFEAVCREKGVPLYQLGKHFHALSESENDTGQVFHYRGLFQNFSDLHISLLGAYQVNNAALALAAGELLCRSGFLLPEAALRAGLKKTRWPGRLEVLRRSPFVVIDGAHNLEAFQGLCSAVRRTFKYRCLVLVLGILSDKAAGHILAEILPLADSIILTKPNSPRAADPHALQKIVESITPALPCEIALEIPAAVDLALEKAAEEDLVLIAGSLYLVSDARHYCKSIE
ncbi:MAG: folylpolyglutamate synthase/dihydrofolate synthase family protein [Bacillota bacterium]